MKACVTAKGRQGAVAEQRKRGLEMDIPLEISFHNMDRSDAVEAKVRERAEKLERYFGHITSCRVVVEAPERRHTKGNLFQVKIEIGVPSRPPLIVNRHPGDKHTHEDVYVAVRDAFDAARRQLEDYAGKIGGKVKAHDEDESEPQTSTG
jgi:ribosomal subunit interface protein